MGQPRVASQPEEKRIKNFNEVSLGYSKKLSSEEARRCPQCSEPVCSQGCPLGIDIPGFIRFLREGSATEAYQKLKEQSALPSICGRICSAPCEAACILTDESAPIGIRALERYASDFGKSRITKKDSPNRGQKVAIIGSGPAGLSAAYDLAKNNCQVTIFESLDKPGGVLRYGIPEFRIPKKVLDSDVNEVKALGVDIQTNFFFGQTADLVDLQKQGYAAVLLTTGAGIPQFMDLPGASLGGVYYGEEFLMRVNLTKANIFARKIPTFSIGQKIAVIGSGNTALDCARTAVRYGRDVTLVFRRTEEEMRVQQSEREYAKQEGVKFEPLVKPIEIMPDQHQCVGGLKCIRMDYADQDDSGKWDLVPVPDSTFILDVDTVVIAIGHRPNSVIKPLISKDGIPVEFNADGTIRVNELTHMTSIPGVFAAGNVVTNAGPVVDAMASGKRAAETMNQYLKQ